MQYLLDIAGETATVKELVQFLSTLPPHTEVYVPSADYIPIRTADVERGCVYLSGNPYQTKDEEFGV